MTTTDEWLAAETGALLRFAAGSAVPAGFGYLDDHGQVDPARPVELWITCRMTHCFSLGTLIGTPGADALAEHGVRALRTAFHDDDAGGWYAALSPAGDVDGPGAVTDKQAYGHAFVVLAAASAVAAGRPGGQDLLDEALHTLARRFWDDDTGLVVEQWDRRFGRLEPYRGVNAAMHTTEACLAAAGVTGDDVWLHRALRILTTVVNDFAPSHHWRIPEHFTPEWEPLLDYNRDDPAHPFRPFGATVGHWLEWARLCLHARAELLARGLDAPSWMLGAPRALFAAAVTEGWAVDGADGFVYTVDFAGTPVVSERMHWVLCEAIAAAAALEQATAEEDFRHWQQTWWDYAREYLIAAPGAWNHELDARNHPSARTWPGRPDIYHALQATLAPRLPLAPAFAPALAAGLLRGQEPTTSLTAHSAVAPPPPDEVWR